MTGFGFVCGLAVIIPHTIIILLGLATYAATGVLTTGLICARGDQRAFCIGALIVVLSTWTRTGGGLLGEIVDVFEWLLRGLSISLPIYFEVALKYVVLIPLAVANGYLCIHARRYFERHATDE